MGCSDPKLIPCKLELELKYFNFWSLLLLKKGFYKYLTYIDKSATKYLTSRRTKRINLKT